MKRYLLTGLIVFLAATIPQSRPAAADQAPSDIIRHSDIDMVSWYPPGQHTVNPSDFRKWGATLVTWGLDSIFANTKNVPEPLSELVKAAHDGGVRSYLANLDMCSAQPWNLAKDAKLREAIARDVDGKGLVVPWFPAVVDGVPAYWGCLNNPVYQENVRQRVRDAAAAGCKGLHVDCANMTAGNILGRYGGCYCPSCMEAFKKYVRNKYSRQQLSDMGINDLDAWDFVAEVKRVAGTAQELPNVIASGRVEQQVPLFRDLRSFVAQSNRVWLEELATLTKQLGGRDAGYSVNAMSIERWLALSSIADFFTCEIRHNPQQKQIPADVIGMYRAAESLGKMLSVTAGTVGDWSYPAKGGMDNLVAMWVAFAYANGHLFIVPNNVWCYSDEKGEHAYVGPDEVLLPLYKFVRRNERLLDGYDPMEQIGVVYGTGGAAKAADGDATRRGRTSPFSQTCKELVDSHYPFGVVFLGGVGRSRGFSEQDLQRFERLVIPQGVAVSSKQAAVLESWKREGRAVPWTDPASALRGIEPLVRVAEGKHVWVYPRKNSKDPAAPVVCHLFNPSYDGKRDAMIEQTDVVISLRSDFSNRRVRKVVYSTPHKEPQELPVSSAEGRIQVTIPKLILWGILSLE